MKLFILIALSALSNLGCQQAERPSEPQNILGTMGTRGVAFIRDAEQRFDLIYCAGERAASDVLDQYEGEDEDDVPRPALPKGCRILYRKIDASEIKQWHAFIGHFNQKNAETMVASWNGLAAIYRSEKMTKTPWTISEPLDDLLIRKELSNPGVQDMSHTASEADIRNFLNLVKLSRWICSKRPKALAELPALCDLEPLEIEWSQD